MDNAALQRRIAELERQLRRAKEEQVNATEQANTLQQMLLAAKHELTDLLSNSNIGAMCLDEHLRIESFTPGIQEHFHIRNEDVGRPLTDLASNLIYPELADDIHDVIAGAPVKEVVIPSKDERWFNMRISPHLQTDGSRLGVVLSLADVTHLTARQTQLMESSEHILTVIKNSPIAVWNQDRDLRYTWLHNPHPGFKQQDVLGKTDDELLLPEEAAVLKKIKQKVLDTGIGSRDKVSTTIKGETYYYDLVVEALTDESSNIVGISCASVAISEEEYHLFKNKVSK